jgi:hypothetical protein
VTGQGGQGMSGIVLARSAQVHREPVPVEAERPAEQLAPLDAVPSAGRETGAAAGPLPLELPKGTALLRVSGCIYEGRERFILALQSDVPMRSTTSPQDLRDQGRPDILLADTVAQGTWSLSFRKLHGWSVTKIALRKWLTELRHDHEHPLRRLIIWDETDFQIPWELFFHETDNPEDCGWLGAHIEVIRWTTVHNETPADWSTGGPSTCHGPILGFIDPSFPSPGMLLSRYGYEPASTMQHLLVKLDDTHREVGLVYVWGHGIPGPNGEVATLAGMPMDRVELYRMPALRHSRAVVLLNACGSAQLMHDDRFGEEGSARSFAEIFLRRGARAVIATSGKVGKIESHDFLQRLLSDAEDAAINLPAALLAYRAGLARGLPPDPGDDPAVQNKLKAFFNGFMYLYFGHPDTALRMLPPGAGA